MKTGFILDERDVTATHREGWSATAGWFYVLRNRIGQDMAFAIILGRMAYEMRKAYGAETAGTMLHALAGAQADEAAPPDADRVEKMQ